VYCEEYELTSDERELYAAFQTYAIEQTGRPIEGFYHRFPLPATELSVFESFAEQHGISVDELIDIRIKATSRRDIQEMPWLPDDYDDDPDG